MVWTLGVLNKVTLETFVEAKVQQLWKKGEPDAKGYFILVPSLASSVTVPKVITAFSESGLEIKGNITEIHNLHLFVHLLSELSLLQG